MRSERGGDTFGHGLIRYEIGTKMCGFQRGTRCGSDGTNGPADGPNVAPARTQPQEEMLDGICAGEYDPVICIELLNGAVQHGVVFERGQFDDGQLNRLRT